ncbi:hypothetical protein BC831DRAFT_497685 [Entophlyctis helioformis]|nr:hypothetical protein BC831DRAFT_497685 [Entophlyctis helioformis]
MHPAITIAGLLLLLLATLRHALFLYDSSMADLHARLAPLGPADAARLALPDIRERTLPAFAESSDNMMHFVQVSDLHVSRFSTKGGLAHLEHFLSHELNLIAPDLHREEWVAYHTALETYGVLRRQQGRFWWDQRGNHDCFNIPSFASSQNMFVELSAVKAEGYAFHLRKPFGVYSFIAVDACPEAGATRPINFFGYLDTKDMDFLASSLIAGKNLHHNHTFVMSHYPTATMLFGHTSDELTFPMLSSHISLWLCGHLHKLAGGLGETMYAYQRTFLELELGDLKSHGMYRIVVVDHDLVSFRDRPPIVLVTNPKDGRYIMPGREPTDLIRNSPSIRVLVWSESRIDRIEAVINEIPHLLVVTAFDEQGLSSNHTVPFRIDGSQITDMDAGAGGFIIGLPFGILFKDLFVISYIVVCIGFLVVPKLFVLITTMLGTYDSWRQSTSESLIAHDVLTQAYRAAAEMPSLTDFFHHRISDFVFTSRATLFRFCEFVNYPSLFYPLLFLNLYLLVGPWFIGEFVPSAPAESGRRYGWMMVYGIWFQDGTWTPLLDNWLFAFYGIVYSILPLEMYLSFCCTSPALLYSPTNPRLFRPIHQRWYVHLIVVISLVYHITDSLSMAIFYGPISAIISPAKTWLTLWATIALWVWRNGPRGTVAHSYASLANGHSHEANGKGHTKHAALRSKKLNDLETP